VIVGGMSFGTLLTLFVVPTAYTLLAGKRAGEEAVPLVVPHAVPAPSHGD
jgi:multidrug efflux pump